MKVSTKIIIGSVLIITFYHMDMIFTRDHIENKPIEDKK